MNTFGIKSERTQYKDREGVYALITDDAGQVVLVGRTNSDLHELPGGGLENGESHEFFLCPCAEATDFNIAGIVIQHVGCFQTVYRNDVASDCKRAKFFLKPAANSNVDRRALFTS